MKASSILNIYRPSCIFELVGSKWCFILLFTICYKNFMVCKICYAKRANLILCKRVGYLVMQQYVCCILWTKENVLLHCDIIQPPHGINRFEAMARKICFSWRGSVIVKVFVRGKLCYLLLSYWAQQEIEKYNKTACKKG